MTLEQWNCINLFTMLIKALDFYVSSKVCEPCIHGSISIYKDMFMRIFSVNLF